MFSNFPHHFVLMEHPSWAKLAQVLDLVRGRYRKMSVGTLCTFIEIGRAQHEGRTRHLTLTELATRLGIAYPTLTRQTDLLGDGIDGRGGLKLIEKKNLEGSQKSKLVDLTPAGLKLIYEIFEIQAGYAVQTALDMAGDEEHEK